MASKVGMNSPQQHKVGSMYTWSGGLGRVLWVQAAKLLQRAALPGA